MKEQDSISRRNFLIKAGTILGATALVPLSGCSPRPAESENSEEQAVKETTSATTIPYTQYASGGVPSDLQAVILFENANATFTKYQVAFTSCTCRDAAVNYSSVMYTEILNTKETSDEASIRQISFAKNDGYTVGAWGDSNPVHGQPTYTQEYLDDVFVQKFVEVTKKDVDAWGGYGTQIAKVDVDAVAGATVSTSNITSVIQSLFSYHAEKYYQG